MKTNVTFISGNKSEHLFVNVGPYKIWESNAVKILVITEI